MRNMLTTMVWVVTIFSIFALYVVKYDTRQLEVRVHEMERQVSRADDEIAHLQVQWGALTRPERIERLARKHLGYGPLRPRQFVTLDEIAQAAQEAEQR